MISSAAPSDPRPIGFPGQPANAWCAGRCRRPRCRQRGASSASRALTSFEAEPVAEVVTYKGCVARRSTASPGAVSASAARSRSWCGCPPRGRRPIRLATRPSSSASSSLARLRPRPSRSASSSPSGCVAGRGQRPLGARVSCADAVARRPEIGRPGGGSSASSRPRWTSRRQSFPGRLAGLLQRLIALQERLISCSSGRTEQPPGRASSPIHCCSPQPSRRRAR